MYSPGSSPTRIKEISFHVVVDGKRTVVEFHRGEKIDSLLHAEESLGSFLCELVGQALEETKHEAT